MAGAAGASTGGESSRGGETEQSDASSSKSKETLGSANFLDLPQPVKYEELQKEAFLCLKPEMFEGARLDFVKPLNNKFSVQHSMYMGNVEVPSQGQQVIKIPAGTYEFGANLIDGNTNLTREKGSSQGIVDLDYKGNDCQGQLKLGNNQFYGANYLQSVSPSLALGGEVFWLGNQMKSGLGLAARHANGTGVSTCQVATTGLLSLTYTHKLSEKVHLATDFLWNWNQREATAAVGYDYTLRQCRLRGRVDSQGTVAMFLEERLNVGINFILSATVDNARKDYSFGFGLSVGE